MMLLGLAGCGDTTARSDTEIDVSGGPTSLFGAEIVSISAGGDGHSLVARINVLPVEGATGACEVEVSHAVEFEADRIYVQVTYLTHDPGQDPTFPGCRAAPRDVMVDLGSPLAGRHVMTHDPAGRWVPGPDGVYGPCELPTCEPGTGASPLRMRRHRRYVPELPLHLCADLPPLP
jgi:hypothetical protein